jgi:hypothetical protein
MSPAHPGEKAGSDRIKAGAWNGLRKAKHALSGG